VVKKLNLGCGKDIREGWDNYDVFPFNKEVKYIKLDKLPLPFPDNYADEINLSRVLEHLVYKKEFLLEISRILKPNGICRIVVPTFNFSIDHKTGIHNKTSIGTVSIGVTENDETKGATPRPFKVVTAKYKGGSISRFIGNLFLLLRLLYNGRVEWVLKKRENPKK
jgi:ubiquinone/menaquinone biosynthesis C-methylase UbiE